MVFAVFVVVVFWGVCGFGFASFLGVLFVSCFVFLFVYLFCLF